MRGIEKDLGLGPNYMCYFTNFISTKCYPTYLFSNKNISASSSRGAVGWGGILCTCLYLLLMQLDFPILIKKLYNFTYKWCFQELRNALYRTLQVDIHIHTTTTTSTTNYSHFPTFNTTTFIVYFFVVSYVCCFFPLQKKSYNILF